MKENIILVSLIISYSILITVQINTKKELHEIHKKILKILTKDKYQKKEEEEQNIDFSKLKKYQKGEYIPLEDVITNFSWLELRMTIKEQKPNIELCYLIRPYKSTEFKILTVKELEQLDEDEKLNNLFISPLFKILD